MIGLKGLRRLSLWKNKRMLTRCFGSEDNIQHKKALTEAEIKALKLRTKLIQTGDQETYMELVKTLKTIEGQEMQSVLYTHPIAQALVSERIQNFMAAQSPEINNSRTLGKYIWWLWLISSFGILILMSFPKTRKELTQISEKIKTFKEKKDPDVQKASNIKERFSDVLGIDQFKQELEQIVDFIKNRNKYLEVGARLPKGILMVGPPGTGKTLMGRALAGEAGSNFIYKAGTQFQKRYVGQGAKQILQKGKPTIIFIDEIDTLARKRQANSPSFTRDTLNQLLQQLDGFQAKDNIIVIGATNHKQSIDPAMLRPGRFDKVIHVPMPDQKGRLALLDYYIQKIKHQKIGTQALAKKIIGFSGADIKNLTNLSILHAIRNNRKSATIEDFDSSITRIRMGVGRKNMYVSDEDKLMTAYHEIGHAFTSIKTKGAVPFNMVTILPRGPALGFTSMVPENDTYSMTKQEMQASIDCLMGGRAAQELFFGESKITTGCGSDLSRATQIAYEYNKNYGMNPKVGLLAHSGDDQNATSDKFNSSVDKQVNIMLKESYARVLKLLSSNQTIIDTIAKKLVEKETMTSEQVKQLL